MILMKNFEIQTMSILPKETAGNSSEIFRSYFSLENDVSCWKNVILTLLKLGNLPLNDSIDRS